MYQLQEHIDLYNQLENNHINSYIAYEKVIELYNKPITDKSVHSVKTKKIHNTKEWKDKRKQILGNECIVCGSNEYLTLQHHFHHSEIETFFVYNAFDYSFIHKKQYYLFRKNEKQLEILDYLNKNGFDINEYENLSKRIHMPTKEIVKYRCKRCDSISPRFRKTTNDCVCMNKKCEHVGPISDFIEFMHQIDDPETLKKLEKEQRNKQIDFLKFREKNFDIDLFENVVINNFLFENKKELHKELVLKLINSIILYRSLNLGTYTYCKGCAYNEELLLRNKKRYKTMKEKEQDIEFIEKNINDFPDCYQITVKNWENDIVYDKIFEKGIPENVIRYVQRHFRNEPVISKLSKEEELKIRINSHLRERIKTELKEDYLSKTFKEYI